MRATENKKRCLHRLSKYVSQYVRWCFEGKHFYNDITNNIIESPYKNYDAGQREYLERLARCHRYTRIEERKA